MGEGSFTLDSCFMPIYGVDLRRRGILTLTDFDSPARDPHLLSYRKILLVTREHLEFTQIKAIRRPWYSFTWLSGKITIAFSLDVQTSTLYCGFARISIPGKEASARNFCTSFDALHQWLR